MIKENKKSANQIVHEAEVTRQHARYKIPAKIEIDGKIYVVDNWSLGGLSVKNAPKDFCNRIHKKAKMLFKFDTFETVVDNLDVEFLCSEKSAKGNFFPLLGARFHNLEDNQISILNNIITSYINGDIITQEDILYAATKNITYQKKEKKIVDRGKADIILILIYLTVFFVFIFLAYTAYFRTYVVESVNGYVDANMTVVRAPYLSYIHFTKQYEVNQSVDQNETLAIARFVDGSMQPILSPVDGTVYKINVLEHEFRDTGEPVITILHKDAQPYVKVRLTHLLFKKVKTGQVAKIRTMNDETFEAKIVDIVPAQELVQDKVKVIQNIYNQARNYDTVILEPLEPIDKKFLDTSVSMTLDTFWQ